MIKLLLLVFITALFSVISFGQANKSVFLKWKLQPEEVLVYNTIMQEIDTANFKDFSFNFGIFSKAFEDTTNSKTSIAKKFFSEINKSLGENALFTKLTEKKPGIIDIEMSTKQKKDTAVNKKDTAKNTAAELSKMMLKMTGNVMLRGAVNEGGSIQSFYVKNDQKNLISMFFELPNRQISVGDKWPLAINLISMDQNFKCDTSYKKNVVTLVDLKHAEGQTIAVLQYDIAEFVSGDFNSPFIGGDKKTMMKMTFNAIAEFSVEKGRWINYDGIMSLKASGVMTSATTKKIKLSVE